MLARVFLGLAALASASAHVCISPARGPSALCATRHPASRSVSVRMARKEPEYDLTDLGPLTKEKRAAYKADRTPKTEYVPDNLAWDGSSLYVLMIPFLVLVCVSLFGGVNLFGCARAAAKSRHYPSKDAVPCASPCAIGCSPKHLSVAAPQRPSPTRALLPCARAAARPAATPSEAAARAALLRSSACRSEQLLRPGRPGNLSTPLRLSAVLRPLRLIPCPERGCCGRGSCGMRGLSSAHAQEFPGPRIDGLAPAADIAPIPHDDNPPWQLLEARIRARCRSALTFFHGPPPANGCHATCSMSPALVSMAVVSTVHSFS